MAKRSENMGWYSGPTILEVLREFKTRKRDIEKPMRFAVQDVYKKEKRIITKFFYPNNLNQKKEREIFDKAFQIRLIKNYISEIIYRDIGKYKDFSKNNLIKDLASKIQNRYLTQKDIEYAILDNLSK